MSSPTTGETAAQPIEYRTPEHGAKSALGLRVEPEWQSAGLRELQWTRQPCDLHFPVILLVGGLDPRNPLGSGSAVLKYHPFKDRWMLVGAMPEPRNYHAAVYVNRVY
ncbi:alpha-scruin-like [Amblyomma americanum]